MYGRTFVVRHNKDLSICLHLIILTAFEQYWTDLSIERQLLQGHLARQLRRYSARTRGTSTHIHDRIPFVCHCLQVCTCNLLCTRNSTWLSVRAVPTTSFCISRTMSAAFCWSRPSWLSWCQMCHLWKTVVCLRWPICLELITWRFKKHFPQPFSFSI